MDPLRAFNPATRAWFEASFLAPTEAQARGWPSIANGDHTLIHAPTGSGKTLAAFLWTLDRLLTEPIPERSARCRVLYVSPMKALAHDVERNLRAPLAGIRHAAQRLGDQPLPELTTFIRTGDTTQEDRRRMERNPPDILITTPESLYLMLTSAVRSTLRTVRWVIVDEVHAVAGSKRGAHLAISLERLEEITHESPQRIGLSATQRPLDTIGRFLGGGTLEGEVWTPRPVTIVDVVGKRDLDIEIVVPVADMSEPGDPDPLDPDAKSTRSIWPAIYPELLHLIRAHSSTIVFANSRRLAERICAEINNLAGIELARAHHGSVSREQRLQIEEALKRGELKAVVATSSLELGIDMGAVDLVIQVESPTSVASGLQRVGRSGHHVGGVSRARIFPKYRGDLLASAVVAREMMERRVEQTRMPENPLDVLAQQVVAHVVATAGTTSNDLFDLARRAAPFAELSRKVFDATLDMLSGRYPSDLFAELRPRVTWDRASDEVAPRPGARQLVVTNPGTIPDRGLYRVTLPDGSRVGELDEEMVYESREGDTFLLGSTTWRMSRITHDRVEVVPAPADAAPKMPFWKGDVLGRPIETGRAIGRFVRETAGLGERAGSVLSEQYRLDDYAVGNLLAYLDEERQATGYLPSDQTIVIERFRDEIGDWRVVLLSPLGARVHAPWALALRHRFRTRYGTDVDAIWSDDGIAFRFPDADDPPDHDDFLLEPEETEGLLIDHLADTAMFAGRFREAAGRALLLPRRRPGERTPLWLQRRRSAELLGVARQFSSFPILLEVYREILHDDFDLPALNQVLGDIRSRRIRVAAVDTTGPSPFASSLLFSFIAAYLYEADAPLAERRATALSLDRTLLRELLGEGELRELIDPEVVVAVELELQWLVESRTANTVDRIHDMLRDLGPLTEGEIDARSAMLDVGEALEVLVDQRRVAEMVVGGSARWAAIEDVARLRDAIGAPPPPGVPHVFLEPVADPLGDVIGRYARTHGPFSVGDAATALGMPNGVVETVLRGLEQAGRIVEGAFRPGGDGREWIDSEVLRRLKRRSLALLRSEIEPVEPRALGRFTPAWQGVRPDPLRGVNGLRDAVRTLTGTAIPASVLERDVLAARVADPATGVDSLLLSGELIWVGQGRIGARDGRVALYPRDVLTSLWAGPDQEDLGSPGKEAILSFLGDNGASFFRDLYEATGGGDPEVRLEDLWDLVWSGHITNDTFEPVRAYLGRRKARSPGRPTLSARFPAHAGGRWSLTRTAVRNAASDTERAAAWAEVILDRHGVVTRSTVAIEGFPGGFSALYPVLSHLEESGRIRRGYFVEGLGGAQFALPGAVDRLRGSSSAGPIVLAATDPANVYGGALPWPDLAEGRLAREAGAYVLLDDGALVGYLDRSRKGLLLLEGGTERLAAVAATLAQVGARHRKFTLSTVNGQPVQGTPLAPTLAEWGFATAPRGLSYRG